MPFTLTHTAAILPITRLAPQLPASALAIGSMLPDAPIFFSLGYGYSFLHSLPGLILAIIPLGLLAYHLFHGYVKEALISLAPDEINKRLNGLLDNQPKASLLLVSMALLLGASTHLIWDLFTHSGRWGVELLPQLQANYSLANHTIAGHKIAQHGSSIVLLPLLAIFSYFKISKLPTVERPQPFPSMRRLTQTIIVLSPLMSSLFVWSLREPHLASFLFETTVLSGMLIIIAVAAYALVIRLQRVIA